MTGTDPRSSSGNNTSTTTATTASPLPTSHLRIARPTRNLAATQRFWVDGLGLRILWRSGPASATEGGHELLMLGWPGAAWHLELVHDPEGETAPSPTEEDLFVLYLDGKVDPAVVERLVHVGGGQRVKARNEYWDKWGVTVRDPDGYLLVLCERSWSNIVDS